MWASPGRYKAPGTSEEKADPSAPETLSPRPRCCSRATLQVTTPSPSCCLTVNAFSTNASPWPIVLVAFACRRSSIPDAFATEMLTRIGAVLSGKRATEPIGQRTGHATQTSRQEAIEVLDDANRVRIAGLIGSLPEGRYIYDLRPLDPTYPTQSHLAIEKTSRSIELTLPAAGLYNITITDALNTPRVDLLLAAIQPAQSAHFQSFNRAGETMEKWNDDYAGWPIDDFLRAYLESLMHSAKAPRAGKAR
jgi:hypothetical protein